jgi:hypothetical protein
MKTTRTYILQTIARGVACLVGVLTLGAGCSTIDDNLDDCYTLAQLKFEYTYNLPRVDKFAEQVYDMDLFVFRVCDSTFVETRHLTSADWGTDNTIGLEWLPQDNYYIVACGNMTTGDYSCTGYERRLTDMDVRFVCDDQTGTVSDQHDHFFYGMVEVKSSDNTTKKVEMIKDTNDVTIVIKDLSHTIANGGSMEAPDAKITADNGTINFDNSIALDDSRLMQYISLYPLGDVDGDPNIYTSMTRVGRLFAGDDSQVHIHEGEFGMLLKTDNLTDAIVKAMREDPQYKNMDSNEYLDRCDSYTLTYELKLEDGVYVAALISVNDWNVITTIPGGL